VDKFIINGVIGSKAEMPEENVISLSDVNAFLANSGDEITVEIESDGGNVDEGIAIYNALKNSGKQITTIGKKINSIASVIFLAGTKRKVYKNVKAHIHSAWIDPANLLGVQLNSETLEQLQKEAEACDKRILSIYTDEVGDDKEQKLMAMMVEATTASSDALYEIGFATEVLNEEYATQNKVITYSNLYNNLFKDETMNAEKLTSIEKAIAKMSNWFTSLFKNMMVKLEDGSDIFIETENDELVGKKVFQVVEGAPGEAAADGEYKLADGRAIVVVAGVIEEVKETPAEEAETIDTVKAQMAAMKAEYESKLAALTSVKNEADTAKANLNEAKTQLQNLAKEFTEFKNQIAFDEPKVTPSQLLQNRKQEELSKSEMEHMRILNKYKNK
jgi:ATP-dependent Clp protease, protease subunit